MRHHHLLSALLLIVSLLMLATAVSADSCSHYFIMQSSGNYTPEITAYTSNGHLLQYYTTWVCTNCRSTKYDLANDPFFPDKVIPHDFSVCKSLGLTSETSHAYKWCCSSASCPYYTTETCNKVEIVDDLGHDANGFHLYVYECQGSHAFSITRGLSCSGNCPIREFNIPPELVTE